MSLCGLQANFYVSFRALQGSQGYPVARIVGVYGGNVDCWGFSLTLSPLWEVFPDSQPILAEQAALLPSLSLC